VSDKKDTALDVQADRQERLNAALRTNLKKRKQQSRARNEKPTDQTDKKATEAD